MRTLGLLAVALLLTACSGETAPSLAPPPTPSDPTASPARQPRPSLDDLPTGHPPRIGYVAHQEYLDRSGRRTALPRRLGVSGIVPYDGGFLVSDTSHFEGTVGLDVVRGRRVIDTYCSSGIPTRTDGWVTWLVAYCPDSADFVRAEIHRARPDGSHESVQRIPPRSVLRVATPVTTAPVPDLPRRWYAAASAREDRHHVLALVVQGRWMAIVRFGPDDVAELAAPVVAHDSNLPAYALGPGR